MSMAFDHRTNVSFEAPGPLVSFATRVHVTIQIFTMNSPWISVDSIVCLASHNVLADKLKINFNVYFERHISL